MRLPLSYQRHRRGLIHQTRGSDKSDPYSRLIAKKGLTLVEILVATTIMVIVVASVYTSFRGGITAWTRGTARMERYLTARAALDMMSREIRAAMVIAADGDNEIDFVGRNATAQVDGVDVDNDSLNFVAPVRGHVDRSDLLQVRYHLVLYDDFGVFEPELQRGVEYGIDDNVMFHPQPTYPITENTISLNFRYWDAQAPYYGGSPGWRDDWDSRTTTPEERPGLQCPYTVNELPAAVEITIKIQDELRPEIRQEFSTIVHLPLSR